MGSPIRPPNPGLPWPGGPSVRARAALNDAGGTPARPRVQDAATGLGKAVLTLLVIMVFAICLAFLAMVLGVLTYLAVDTWQAVAEL